VITSPQMTNEELYLVRKIFFDHLKIPLLHYHISPKAEASEDNFLIRKDKNPNTMGAELILSEQKGLPVEGMLELARNETIKLIYIMHANLVSEFGLNQVREALNIVPTVIYQGTNNSEMVDFSTYVLPAATYAEKDGTFTNHQGRVQRIFSAVTPLEESRPSLDIFGELASHLGVPVKSTNASDVFDELAAEFPAFSGMSYKTIGHSGQSLQVPVGVMG